MIHLIVKPPINAIHVDFLAQFRARPAVDIRTIGAACFMAMFCPWTIFLTSNFIGDLWRDR